MPRLSQGDIFQAAPQVQLAIVFGRVGFNNMSYYWQKFSARQTALHQTRDPFTDLSGHAVEWSPGRWLWFVADQENGGMTDEQLTKSLDTALSWHIKTAFHRLQRTVANIDHGHNTANNRRSDESRSAYLEDYAKRAEQKYSLSIELVNLNDIFVRNRYYYTRQLNRDHHEAQAA